ncbi:hypothetical protein [Agrobacterium fabrum]|uniref:hypothetical protein n=1 Tax=Agrobacterium fabrum TaxID=1176649 RepID=UPI00215766E5|nr:hypothetical protein [Agrobacterium fabrum]MCR6727247.1 hypothetical protein [Agrobacterium fabrum]MDH6297997.1 hypothetical protein [Agrobacterium fabrum]
MARDFYTTGWGREFVRAPAIPDVTARRDIDYDAPLSRPPPVGLLPPPPSFVSTIIDLSGPENYIA